MENRYRCLIISAHLRDSIAGQSGPETWASPPRLTYAAFAGRAGSQALRALFPSCVKSVYDTFVDVSPHRMIWSLCMRSRGNMPLHRLNPLLGPYWPPCTRQTQRRASRTTLEWPPCLPLGIRHRRCRSSSPRGRFFARLLVRSESKRRIEISHFLLPEAVAGPPAQNPSSTHRKSATTAWGVFRRHILQRERRITDRVAHQSNRLRRIHFLNSASPARPKCVWLFVWIHARAYSAGNMSVSTRRDANRSADYTRRPVIPDAG